MLSVPHISGSLEAALSFSLSFSLYFIYENLNAVGDLSGECLRNIVQKKTAICLGKPLPPSIRVDSYIQHVIPMGS